MKIFEKKALESSGMVNERGRLWACSLDGVPTAGDDSTDNRRSTMRLLEDGRPLGPAHAMHETIATEGEGAFSHWGETLYFSSSDGSDPSSNGRSYTVKYLPEERMIGDLDDDTVEELAELIVSGMEGSVRKRVIEEVFRTSLDSKHWFGDLLRNEKETMLRLLLRDLTGLYGASLAQFLKFRIIYEAAGKNGLEPGARVMELGPGRTPGLGLMFLLCGAESYSGFEAYPDEGWGEANALRNLVDVATRFYPQADLERFEGILADCAYEDERWNFAPERLRLVEMAGAMTTLPSDDGVYDLTFSVSVFEHVEKVSELIGELARITRPGGLAVHSVDLSDHNWVPWAGGGATPIEFLRYGRKEWKERFTGDNAKFYTNQLRRRDFRKAFEEAGFRIESTDDDATGESPYVENPIADARRNAWKGFQPEMREWLHADFKEFTDEDLSAIGVQIVARKI